MSKPEDTTPAPQVVVQRPPFFQVFAEMADNAAKHLLNELPELDAVVIIPCWLFNGTDLPKASIATRSGNMLLKDLFSMSGKLTEVQNVLGTSMMRQLAEFDAAAQQIAKDIRDKQAELDQLNHALAQRQPADR